MEHRREVVGVTILQKEMVQRKKKVMWMFDKNCTVGKTVQTCLGLVVRQQRRVAESVMKMRLSTQRDVKKEKRKLVVVTGNTVAEKEAVGESGQKDH
jgi:hypothetical protein